MEGAKLPIHELRQLLASMASIIKDNDARIEEIASTSTRLVAVSDGIAPTPVVSRVCSVEPHDMAPPSTSHTAAPIHTSELDVDLPTKCATTGLDHDIGRNLAAVTYPCTGCVATAPWDATPTPARRPAAVFELDKWTPTRCLMLGSGTDTFDDTTATTSLRLRAECTAIPVPSEAPPFMVLSPFTVLEFDAPPHTIDSSTPSGAPSSFPSPSTAVAATCAVVPPTGVESSLSNSTKFSPSSAAVSEVPLASTDCSMQVCRQDSNTLLADNVQLCLSFWSPFRLRGFAVQYRSPWPPPMQCGCSTIFSELWCISPFWPLPWLPPVHNSSESRFTKPVQEFLWSIPLHMISAVTLEQLLASVQRWQLEHGTPLLKCNLLLIMGARQATCSRLLSYDSGRVHINIQFNRWPKLFSLLFYLLCCCTPLTARDEDLQLPPIGVTVVLPPPAKPPDSDDILFHACSYWVFSDDGAALPYSTLYASAFDSKQEPWFRLLFAKLSPAQITIFFLEDCTSSAGTYTTEKQCGASDRWDCGVVLNISVLFQFARSSAVELDTNFMVCNCSPLSPHWTINYAPVIKFHHTVEWLSEGSIGNFFAFRPYLAAHVGHDSDELVAGTTPIPMQLATHSAKDLLVHFVVQRPGALNMFEERCPASEGIRPFDTEWSGGVLTLLAMHRFNSGNLLIPLLGDPGDCYWSNLVVYVGCGACKLGICPVFRMAVTVRVLVLDDLLTNFHKSSLGLVASSNGHGQFCLTTELKCWQLPGAQYMNSDGGLLIVRGVGAPWDPGLQTISCCCGSLPERNVFHEPYWLDQLACASRPVGWIAANHLHLADMEFKIYKLLVCRCLNFFLATICVWEARLLVYIGHTWALSQSFLHSLISGFYWLDGLYSNCKRDMGMLLIIRVIIMGFQPTCEALLVSRKIILSTLKLLQNILSMGSHIYVGCPLSGWNANQQNIWRCCCGFSPMMSIVVLCAVTSVRRGSQDDILSHITLCGLKQRDAGQHRTMRLIGIPAGLMLSQITMLQVKLMQAPWDPGDAAAWGQAAFEGRENVTDTALAMGLLVNGLANGPSESLKLL